jgi:CRP-like cAMP-binding protein
MTSADIYQIWGIDDIIYGPVDLNNLIQWVKEERVNASTWVHVKPQDMWVKAGQIGEIQGIFQEIEARNVAIANPVTRTPLSYADLKPGELRRIKVLSNLSDDQLTRLKHYITLQPVLPWSVVVKEGDPGDAMFFVLEGELRVRLLIGGKESQIATLQAGDFFGEFCLFDHGPRSADVVANASSQLLVLSASAFYRLAEEAPELAAPFLMAISKTLVSRIRADNRRFQELINIARVSA